MTLLDTRVGLTPDDVARAFLEGNAPEYVRVPGLTRAHIERNIQGFMDFLANVPYAEQTRWGLEIPRNPNYREPDDGFLRKNEDADKTSDKKCLFQVRDDLLTHLAKAGVEVSSSHLAWIREMQHVRALCNAQVFNIAEAIDRLAPGCHLVERMLESEEANSGMYRIGVYDAGSRGFAKEHVDRNCITLHLGASHAGLYFKTPHGDVQGIDPESGEALAFPGAMMQEVTHGAIKALKHGTNPCGGNARRWFAVFFAYIAV